MPVKYVDPNTGEFLPDALKNTGAPSRYGIKTAEDLVATSLSSSMTGVGKKGDIFFSGNARAKL